MEIAIAEKDNNFALIHIIGATMVIWGHMSCLLGLPAPTFLNFDVHGQGVNILFVVSGFLVAKSYDRDPSIIKFYFKRLMRIYPSLILCVVVCAIAEKAFSIYDWTTYSIGAKGYVINNLLMRPQYELPGVFWDNPYPKSVNGALWTLPIELLCFFVLPFVLNILKLLQKWLKATKTIALFAGAILLSLAAIFIERTMAGQSLAFWATDWLQSVRLLAYFFWGVAFSSLSLHRIETICRGDIAVLTMVACSCMGAYFPKSCNYIIIPYVVMSFAYLGKDVGRDFFNRHDYAYGLYLWSFPVQQVVICCLYNKCTVSIFVYFLISFAIAMILAVITNKAVEMPVQKSTLKLLRKNMA